MMIDLLELANRRWRHGCKPPEGPLSYTGHWIELIKGLLDRMSELTTSVKALKQRLFINQCTSNAHFESCIEGFWNVNLNI